MSNAIAVAKKKPIEREHVVLARTPEELSAAHVQMMTWADNRIADARAELRDLRANLIHAEENSWDPRAWKRHIKRVDQRIVYYSKIRSALNEGFCIVPNFPIDVFAVKTKRKKPNPAIVTSRYVHGLRMSNINSDQSPQGEGEYRDPATLNETWEETGKDKDGKDETIHCRQAVDLAPPEFPFTLVKPEILENVSFAKTVKIFDELGVMPDRRRRSGGDPMIVGRIKMHNSWNSKQMTFLLAWWMNPEEF